MFSSGASGSSRSSRHTSPRHRPDTAVWCSSEASRASARRGCSTSWRRAPRRGEWSRCGDAAGRKEAPRPTGPGCRSCAPSSGGTIRPAWRRSSACSARCSPRSSRSCRRARRRRSRTRRARVTIPSTSASCSSTRSPPACAPASARDPLLVLLDDVHAADRPSLRLLAFLGRELRGTPVLVVCAHRDAEVRAAPAVAEALAHAAREGAALHLAGLPERDVARFVEARAGVRAVRRHRDGAAPPDGRQSVLPRRGGAPARHAGSPHPAARRDRRPPRRAGPHPRRGRAPPRVRCPATAGTCSTPRP